jgi:hypothetical protein
MCSLKRGGDEQKKFSFKKKESKAKGENKRICNEKEIKSKYLSFRTLFFWPSLGDFSMTSAKVHTVQRYS